MKFDVEIRKSWTPQAKEVIHADLNVLTLASNDFLIMSVASVLLERTTSTHMYLTPRQEAIRLAVNKRLNTGCL